MPFTIYMVTCPEGRNYVGCTRKTAEARWAGHFRAIARSVSEPTNISEAIAKFGRDAFTLRVLAVADNAEDAAAIETMMIERYGALRPRGYNWMGTSHYAPARWKAA